MSEQVHEYPCAKCGVECSEWNHGGFMPDWQPLCRTCVDAMKAEGIKFQPYLETRRTREGTISKQDVERVGDDNQ